LGFYAATTLEEKRVHVRLSSAPRFCRGVRPQVPPRRLRCRSQVFPTSQRPSSSLHRPTIFRWVASVRFALQGFVPSTKPRRLVVARPTLLTLFPRADRSPFLGGDTRRRGGSYLGAFIRRLLFVYRVFVLVKVDRTHHLFLHSGNVRPAPLGLSPPHGVHPSETGRGSPLATVELHEQQAVACLPPAALHGFPLTRADPLSQVDRPVSRFLACNCLPRLACHQVRAYRPCDLSPRSVVPRRRDPCEPLNTHLTHLPEPEKPTAPATCSGASCRGTPSPGPVRTS